MPVWMRCLRRIGQESNNPTTHSNAEHLAPLFYCDKIVVMSFRRVYLDNAATTPIDPAVVEAMMPYLTDKFGNASSIHFFGQEAKGAIDKARHQVASLLNARPNEIVFTSGGTEANNLAIRGLVHRTADVSSASRISLESPTQNNTSGTATLADGTSAVRSHIITSSIEHPSVLNVCEDLEKQGCEITYLPVYENGIVRIEDVREAFKDNTVLISIMTANNEIGTLQPVEEIGRFVKGLKAEGRKIWFHTDAVQAAGKIKLDVEEIGCDLLSISAHKIYAPKGTGALYVRRGVRLHAQNIGGHQERERRGGTESIPNIVAFGRAAELAQEEIGHCGSPHEVRASTSSIDRIRTLRDRFESEIGEIIPDLVYNGDRDRRLPNISNISFRRIEGEALLINLDMQGIAVSTGSACSSGTLEPSPVIRALGHDDELARGAIRFSLGRFNESADIESLIRLMPDAVETLRNLAPKQS
jgi:cysteine desulfurase